MECLYSSSFIYGSHVTYTLYITLAASFFVTESNYTHLYEHVKALLTLVLLVLYETPHRV